MAWCFVFRLLFHCRKAKHTSLHTLYHQHAHTESTILLQCTTVNAGERFTQDELDEMLSAAVDKEKGIVLYRDFVLDMLPEQSQIL